MSGMPALPPLGSSTGAGAASGLPTTVAATAEPEFVHDGSPAVKNAYKEALGFEEMLVEQLSQSLAQTSGLGEGGETGGGEAESEGEASGSTGLVSSMLPQTLSEAVTRGGGLGLATQLTTEIDPSALSSTKASS